MINPFKPDPVKKTYDIKFAKVDADCPCGSRSQQEIAYVDTDGETWRWRYMEFDNGVPTRTGDRQTMPV